MCDHRLINTVVVTYRVEGFAFEGSAHASFLRTICQTQEDCSCGKNVCHDHAHHNCYSQDCNTHTAGCCSCRSPGQNTVNFGIYVPACCTPDYARHCNGCFAGNHEEQCDRKRK